METIRCLSALCRSMSQSLFVLFSFLAILPAPLTKQKINGAWFVIVLLVVSLCSQHASGENSPPPRKRWDKIELAGDQLRRPNVIVILADDLGYGDLSLPPFVGGGNQTPNLERMAAQEGAVTLTNFHTAGSVCSPTRASILTGLYPWRVGIDEIYGPNQQSDQLPVISNNVAWLFKRAGYHTAHIGKWHLGGMKPADFHQRAAKRAEKLNTLPSCAEAEFAEFSFRKEATNSSHAETSASRGLLNDLKSSRRPGSVSGGGTVNGNGGSRAAASNVRRRDGGSAVGSKFRHAGPAAPSINDHGFTEYIAQQEGENSVRLKTLLPKNLLYREGARYLFKNEVPYEIKPEHGTYTNPPILTDLEATEAIETAHRSAIAGKSFYIHLWFNAPHRPLEYIPPSAEQQEKAKNGNGSTRLDQEIGANPGTMQGKYRSMVENMDFNVGRVMDSLEEMGLLDNTILVFFSDNGPEDGHSGGFIGRKRSLHEGGIRVPSIWMWRGKNGFQRKTIGDFALSTDLLPTLLEAAGIPLPRGIALDGISILHLLRNRPSADATNAANASSIDVAPLTARSASNISSSRISSSSSSRISSSSSSSSSSGTSGSVSSSVRSNSTTRDNTESRVEGVSSVHVSRRVWADDSAVKCMDGTNIVMQTRYSSHTPSILGNYADVYDADPAACENGSSHTSSSQSLSGQASQLLPCSDQQYPHGKGSQQSRQKTVGGRDLSEEIETQSDSQQEQQQEPSRELLVGAGDAYPRTRGTVKWYRQMQTLGAAAYDPKTGFKVFLEIPMKPGKTPSVHTNAHSPVSHTSPNSHAASPSRSARPRSVLHKNETSTGNLNATEVAQVATKIRASMSKMKLHPHGKKSKIGEKRNNLIVLGSSKRKLTVAGQNEDEGIAQKAQISSGQPKTLKVISNVYRGKKATSSMMHNESSAQQQRAYDPEGMVPRAVESENASSAEGCMTAFKVERGVVQKGRDERNVESIAREQSAAISRVSVYGHEARTSPMASKDSIPWEHIESYHSSAVFLSSTYSLPDLEAVRSRDNNSNQIFCESYGNDDRRECARNTQLLQQRRRRLAARENKVPNNERPALFLQKVFYLVDDPREKTNLFVAGRARRDGGGVGNSCTQEAILNAAGKAGLVQGLTTVYKAQQQQQEQQQKQNEQYETAGRDLSSAILKAHNNLAVVTPAASLALYHPSDLPWETTLLLGALTEELLAFSKDGDAVYREYQRLWKRAEFVHGTTRSSASSTETTKGAKGGGEKGNSWQELGWKGKCEYVLDMPWELVAKRERSLTPDYVHEQ